MMRLWRRLFCWGQTIEDLHLQLTKLSVGPDDIVVLSTPHRITPRSAALIREQWDQLGRVHKVAVFDDGAEIRIVPSA